jgi:hypothetical protein
MHVEVMDDGVMIAECCLSSVVALIALGCGVRFATVHSDYDYDFCGP